MIYDRRTGAKFFPVISGAESGAGAGLAMLALRCLSTIYYVGYRLRLRRYEAREKTNAGAPVISVGNITLGGTGKTPVCIYLAKRIAATGLKVGIATRGYGREGGGTVILKDAGAVRSWHLCGDEPVLFLNEPSVSAVAVDADRARAARALASEHGCDVILLDDGFQFITLERNVDIVVIDAGNPFGYGRLFPAGLLREPLSELARADVFWIAKGETIGDKEREELRKRLNRDYPGKPVIESRYGPSGFVAYKQPDTILDVDSLRGRPVLCVSGIGNPESFEALIRKITEREIFSFRFNDHHPFGDGDLSRVEDEAVRSGVEYIVTTEKDAARLPGHFKPRCRWLVLRVEVEVTGGAGDVDVIVSLCEKLARRDSLPYNMKKF